MNLRSIGRKRNENYHKRYTSPYANAETDVGPQRIVHRGMRTIWKKNLSDSEIEKQYFDIAAARINEEL